ncbi:putative ribonuclease H-like domain-containing protein [Tanacetum coccineum]
MTQEWHMTGNKDQLEDFEEFNGGSVTFGGSKGYISGKGRIRVGNLDFDSVSFVKELGHFNLFSISQICDKQHKVLFTETECLVVSSDFKMPDENQILLKVPRHHNMYSFDMKTPSPAKGFACLIAKATSDESKLWHRRLGHINFKNLNKLVKGNLVRGLPSKVFKNDHTCVACHKGKQHRASCKAKLERLITVPLHTLHMDLFGPTSLKSINHASYLPLIPLKNVQALVDQIILHKDLINRDMLEFCGNKRIKQEYSTARTPQQNGVAERMNKTLIEAARTMLANTSSYQPQFGKSVSTSMLNLMRYSNSIASEEKDQEEEHIVVPSSYSSFLEESGRNCPKAFRGHSQRNNTSQELPSVIAEIEVAKCNNKSELMLSHSDIQKHSKEKQSQKINNIFVSCFLSRRNLKSDAVALQDDIGVKPCKKNCTFNTTTKEQFQMRSIGVNTHFPKRSPSQAEQRRNLHLSGQGKPNLGLWYPRESPFDLEAFSDSDYGGSNLDRKSTTGGLSVSLTKTYLMAKARNRTIEGHFNN